MTSLVQQITDLVTALKSVPAAVTEAIASLTQFQAFLAGS